MTITHIAIAIGIVVALALVYAWAKRRAPNAIESSPPGWLSAFGALRGTGGPASVGYSAGSIYVAPAPQQFFGAPRVG